MIYMYGSRYSMEISLQLPPRPDLASHLDGQSMSGKPLLGPLCSCNAHNFHDDATSSLEMGSGAPVWWKQNEIHQTYIAPN